MTLTRDGRVKRGQLYQPIQVYRRYGRRHQVEPQVIGAQVLPEGEVQTSPEVTNGPMRTDRASIIKIRLRSTLWHRYTTLGPENGREKPHAVADTNTASRTLPNRRNLKSRWGTLYPGTWSATPVSKGGDGARIRASRSARFHTTIHGSIFKLSRTSAQLYTSPRTP